MSHTSLSIDPAEAREIKRLKTELARAEAFGVSPATAEQMLPCSHKKLYDLLNAGELEGYKVGRARRVTLASIKAYITRQLAQHPAPKTRRRAVT